jgi:hypothetical protein
MHVDQDMDLVLGCGIEGHKILYGGLWTYLQYIPPFQVTLMALQDC